MLFLSVFNTNRPAESITKLAQIFLCLTLNKKNGNHCQYVRPSTSESSGLNLHFAFFKLIRTLEENILRGLKDWLKKCIFHPKITI